MSLSRSFRQRVLLEEEEREEEREEEEEGEGNEVYGFDEEDEDEDEDEDDEDDDEEEERNNKEFLLLLSEKWSSSPSLRDFWSELPADIKVDILCRLPEKDLYKYTLREKNLIGAKLVCKDWNFLISKVCLRRFSPPSPSATFCGFLTFEEPETPPQAEAPNNNNNNNNTITTGSTIASSNEKRFSSKLTLGFIPIGEYMLRVHGRRNITLDARIMALLRPEHKASDIRDCCNGLLLLASNRRSPIQYYVCNPATKQCRAIPVNPNHHHNTSSYNYYSSLVFDLSSDNNFGCSYKIVHHIHRLPAAEEAMMNISKVSGPLELELDVFWSETGEWSSHVVPLQFPHNHSLLYRFSLGGSDWIRQTLYWKGILYYLLVAGYLVCVDMNILPGAVGHSKEGACWAVELPDTQENQGTQQNQEFVGCIGISAGCFCYSKRHSLMRSAVMVWMLLDPYSSKWVLRHSINADKIIGTVPFEKLIEKVRDSCWPCAFHPFEDQIIYMAVPQPPLLISYCLRTTRAHMATLYWSRHGNMVLEQNMIFPYSRCLVRITQP